MITGTQQRVISSSATAFKTTSGPIPDGSPMVMATRGSDPEFLGFGDELLANCLIDLRPKRNKEGRAAQCANLASDVFHALVRFEHIFDISLEQQKVWCVLAVDLQSAAVIPL